jgi:hypothetical protein
MASQIKNAAVLHNVNEVSLLGAADLENWRRRLEPEQLEPVAHEGRAQLLIIAADAKFMGLRFRELSFSVFARDVSGPDNSERLVFDSRVQLAAVVRLDRADVLSYAVLSRRCPSRVRTAGLCVATAWPTLGRAF